MKSGSRRVVSLCGPSGSGKSTIAKALVVAMGDEQVARVPADHYLCDVDDGVGPTWSGHDWDWERLAADLIGPDGRQVETPAYDFTRFRRDAQSGSRMNYRLRPIMVVDAMRPFPGADLVVWIAVPAPERRRRLADRDLRWESRVADRWDILEASAPDGPPDSAIHLDGGRPLVNLVDEIAAQIRSRVGLPDDRDPGIRSPPPDTVP